MSGWVVFEEISPAVFGAGRRFIASYEEVCSHDESLSDIGNQEQDEGKSGLRGPTTIYILCLNNYLTD